MIFWLNLHLSQLKDEKDDFNVDLMIENGWNQYKMSKSIEFWMFFWQFNQFHCIDYIGFQKFGSKIWLK